MSLIENIDTLDWVVEGFSCIGISHCLNCIHCSIYETLDWYSLMPPTADLDVIACILNKDDRGGFRRVRNSKDCVYYYPRSSITSNVHLCRGAQLTLHPEISHYLCQAVDIVTAL